MKRVVVILMAFAMMAGAFAQTLEKNNAFTHYRKGKIDKAKAAIDACMQYPDAQKDAEVWFYRGNIYLQISARPEYAETVPDAIDIAYDSYRKAIEIDQTVANRMVKPVSPIYGLYECRNVYYNTGIKQFNEQHYAAAIRPFDRSARIAEVLTGRPDNSAIYMTALSAQWADSVDLAIQTYSKLVHLEDYVQPEGFINLSELYMTKKQDMTKAVNCINKAATLMPDSLKVLQQQFIVLNKAGKAEEAAPILAKLETKAKESNSALTFAIIAQAMEQAGDFEKAEYAYNKALEIDPNNYDVLYNVTILYYNRYADIEKEANNLPMEEEAKYKELKELAKTVLAKGKAPCEKALLKTPDDQYLNIMKKKMDAVLK